MNDLTSKIASARENLAALYSTAIAANAPWPVQDDQIRKNRTAAAVSIALLESFADVSPLVYEASRAQAYDLLAHWGIDPQPLFSLNPPDMVARGFRQIFGQDAADLDIDYDKALADLVEVNRRRLLGKSTAAKMAYLKPITGKGLKHLTADSLKEHFPEVVDATIDLLDRQARRLRRQSAACTHIDHQILNLSGLLVRFHVQRLYACHPLFKVDPGIFYRVYADEVAQLMAAYADNPCFEIPIDLDACRYLRKTGIEVAYTRRDAFFLNSGDYYGDCTASEVRSQVDPEIANIHWTVYAWLLDPYYRVLDVYFHGRRVMKGHILPLIIHGRRILMLDAIETIPSIRDFLRGRRNRNISRTIYARRLDILQALFDAVKDLAGRMGVEAVYVDKYSNTKWVRSEVNKLPADSYHISDVIKPFKNDLIVEVIGKILNATAGEVEEEIQARNISLMDQQLRPNYKEVGVLMGRRKDYFIAVRGI